MLAIVNDLRPAKSSNRWGLRYGRRHGYVRVTDPTVLPDGRRGRVTVYRRGGCTGRASIQQFILSWCLDGRHRKERIDGDILDAIRSADAINEAIRYGSRSSRVTNASLPQIVSHYLEYLGQRADAGEISPGTPDRYRQALVHLSCFSELNNNRKTSTAWVPTRDYVLRFKAYLMGKKVSGRGCQLGPRKNLTGPGISFIVDTARAMVRWAVREGILSTLAAEAFTQATRERTRRHTMSFAPLAGNDIAEMIQYADLYQLTLLSFHIFHGVRVAEPCWLMLESVDLKHGWVDYRCIDELGYRTKGGVDKRLPVAAPMIQLMNRIAEARSGGPVLLKRRFFEGTDKPIKPAESLKALVREVQKTATAGWVSRARTAQACLKKAGATDGDDIRREFMRLTRAAGIQRQVTPKALRHHFATALERADVPYYTRKYLLGHRLDGHGGRSSDITAVYTHLEPDFVKAAYQRVLDGPLAGILEAFNAQMVKLSVMDSQKE